MDASRAARPRPHQITRGERLRFSALLLGEHLVGRKRIDSLTRNAPQRLQARMAKRLEREGSAEFEPVERRKDLDPDEFRERYLRTGTPVVLVGAARDWPSTREWTLPWFRDHYGEAAILAQDLDGFDASDARWEGAPEVRTLGRAIDEMLEGHSTYVRFGTVVDEHPELQQMLDQLWLDGYRTSPAGSSAYNFFIGRSGTTTQLHAAFPCNLFAMVHGRKQWTLYPARATAALRPAATGGQYFYTDADPDAPDPARWPALPYVAGQRVVIEQGDVLYNPPYMWHHVVNLTDSIGVGVRFNHVASTLRATWTLPLLRALAWNPPPWVTLAALVRGRSSIRQMGEWRTAPGGRGSGG